MCLRLCLCRHMWCLVKARLFQNDFELSTYLLGNKKCILAMFRHWDELSNGLAVKLLFKKNPIQMLSFCTWFLMLMASYCIRVAESPVNRYHNKQFWNQLWLVVVTMTTVGYGDSVPYTHFGRMVLVMVMISGTILVSMMTAAATGFLNFTKEETLLTNHSEWEEKRTRVTKAMVCYLQYVWRVDRGHRQEDWMKRNELRREFWKALHQYQVSAV